mgnify:CR=1 FL=1
MITKERIELQGYKVLATNPSGQKVIAKVVGFEDDMALVKFRCLFEPVKMPLSCLYEVPIPSEIGFEEVIQSPTIAEVQENNSTLAEVGTPSTVVEPRDATYSNDTIDEVEEEKEYSE